MNKEFEEFEKYFVEKKFDDSDLTITRKKHKCPHCAGFLDDTCLEQNTLPEIPCPSCGSLIDISAIKDVEVSTVNERADRRYKVSLKVTYKSFNKFITEYAKNVSNGGMFLNTRTEHKIGSNVNLFLHVPGLEKPVRIIGEIIHTEFLGVSDEDVGVGIRFIDIDETSRQLLINFIKFQKD